MRKALFILVLAVLFSLPFLASARSLNLIYLQSGNVKILNPETANTYYDELKGKPRDYFINSVKDFPIYLSISVPEESNPDGIYSVKVFSETETNGEQLAYSLDGGTFSWTEYYDKTFRDFYLNGPTLDQVLPAGKYKIEVYSVDNYVPPAPETDENGNLIPVPVHKSTANTGKYILNVGRKEAPGILSQVNIFWQLPFLKVTFFKSLVLQFFLTIYGIITVGVVGLFLIFVALIYFIAGAIHQYIKHNQAKTMLLTSTGMHMKKEIIGLLQKPAYDITVAFISTAAKSEDNLEYLRMDWNVMRDEMGFNVEEIDIEGKSEAQVMNLLQYKDIIYVEGGNTFYLMKVMRECNFEKIIRKLLKFGKVYIGSSAGSIVAGRTIKPAEWIGDKNIVGLNDMRGLNILGFNIVCHYRPELAEIIKKEMPNDKKRAKNLRIITDQQAILVQGSEEVLIGEGEKAII